MGKLDLASLNANQLYAVKHKDGVLQCASIPGSGKTRVLTYRVAYLIQHHKVPVENILVTTFSKKAATEMKDRLAGIVGANAIKNLAIGTLHSIGYRILKHEYTKLGDSRAGAFQPHSDQLLSYNAQRWLIEHILRENNIRFTDDEMTIKEVIRRIGMYKNQLVDDFDYQFAFAETEDDYKFATVFQEYEARKRENAQIDFDDMLLQLWKLLGEHDDILHKYQNKFQYILSDESQDMNTLMYALIKLLGEPHNNIFVIGDEDQCQPPGSMVLTQEEGYLPIEQIDPEKHHLVSYARGESKVIGLRKGYTFKKAVRHFSGELLKIKALDKETMCTPEHKWLVKWNNEAKKQDKNVVYLMQQGDRFRVGWCQLFRVDGGFHLGHRARLEKADATWILKVVDNKTDAYAWESFIASKYGIPTMPFEPVNNAQHITRETIDKTFDMLGNILNSRVKNCLQDFGLSLRYPIWSPQRASAQQGGASIMELEACNMLSGLMMVPVYSGNSSISWETVKITKVPYEGNVYSLDVDKYHTYVVDDLVTHNCIYGFNGAAPEHFVSFASEYKEQAEVILLDHNYRSNQTILDVASNIINNNTERTPKQLKGVPSNQAPNDAINYELCGDEFEESVQVVKHINNLVNDGAFYSDFAILYRTNAQTAAVEQSLIKQRIPYVIEGGTSFYERREIKDLLAYLSLAINPHDDEAFERVINTPGRYLGHAAMKQIKEVAKNHHCSYYDASKLVSLGSKQMVGLRGYCSAIDYIHSRYTKHVSVPSLIAEILDHTGYYNTLKEEGKEEDNNNCDNINVLQHMAQDYKDPAVFVASIKFLTPSRRNGKFDAVKLMTIHKSKGLEFKNVFIVGMVDGVLPLHHSLEDEKAIEEERRLAYVAVTRAQERLFILSPLKYGGKAKVPSIFVAEAGLRASTAVV